MCKCTPEIRTPHCVNCAFPEHTISLPKIDKIPPMPPVVKPPLCNLRAFYEAAGQHLSHATFMELVEKALQRDGI